MSQKEIQNQRYSEERLAQAETHYNGEKIRLRIG